MKNYKIIAVSVLMSSLIFFTPVLAAESVASAGAGNAVEAGFQQERYSGELADFKQKLAPFLEAVSLEDPVFKSEWEVVQAQVLDEKKGNEPVLVSHWAALLKMLLNLKGGNDENLLDTYVYQQADKEEITREAAVGGLIKLLNVRGYVKGSSTAEELKPADSLKDLKEIDFKQEILVKMAHVQGILDSTVSDRFRPKDPLTHAEAVSMLSRMITKFHMEPSVPVHIEEGHWASSYAKEYVAAVRPSGEAGKILNRLCSSREVLDAPIPVLDWNTLLWQLLKLEEAKEDRAFIEVYTYGLAQEGYITRDHAVAGLVKLLHVKGMVKGRDAYKGEEIIAAGKFTDFKEVFDQSKLSIAYAQELIVGYEDRTFGVGKLLTAGEAVTLLNRVARKYAVK